MKRNFYIVYEKIKSQPCVLPGWLVLYKKWIYYCLLFIGHGDMPKILRGRFQFAQIIVPKIITVNFPKITEYNWRYTGIQPSC